MLFRSPEHGGATVAENDLPSVGQSEQIGESVSDPTDEVLDGRLSMRRAEQSATGGGESVDLLGTNLRRTASETSVSGQEIRRNPN